MTNNEIHFCYELIDPRDTLPFYIGVTINLHVRFWQHVQHEEDTAKKQKIDAILKSKLLPIIHVLAQHSEKKAALKEERAWMQFYLDQGIQLTNRRYNPTVGPTYEDDELEEGTIFTEMADIIDEFKKANIEMDVASLDYYLENGCSLIGYKQE